MPVLPNLIYIFNAISQINLKVEMEREKKDNNFEGE
jgi:hypothetical protein